MDNNLEFLVSIGEESKQFVQLNDAFEYIKEYIAQWNNFGDQTMTQVINIVKVPSKTPTIGITASESVETLDVFGGIPERYTEEQKKIYAKLKKAQDVFNQS